jgi:hypothetical protein
MGEGNVRKWCRFFKEGRSSLRGVEHSVHSSLVTDIYKEKSEYEKAK